MGGRGRFNDREERKEIIDLINEAVQSGARKIKACETIDVEIRTIQRWEKDSEGDKREMNKSVPLNKLSSEERKKIIEICCNDRFKDMNPHSIVPILAEDGEYYGSESTYYRVLNEEKLLNHRSDSKPAQKRHKPDELEADGPDQVLSWDITYLLSLIKGEYYYLYMFLDIWSRKIVGWDVYEEERSELSSELMKRISKENNVAGVYLHSDNGSPMKGATMLGTLQNLGVIPSFSRPSVSNDNPYSEALFKTIKYKASYPERFKSIDDAREWIGNFVEWYNNEHRHSKIKYVTPEQRHTGKDIEILKKREETYKNAMKRNPERWTGESRNWDRIKTVSLNPKNKQRANNKAA